MPAVWAPGAGISVEKREWRNTVGQSGMTPTAFAFLVPVFVVVVFAPFLCIFCIRKRSRRIPPTTKVKKPALRRAEARERLKLVTDVSTTTNGPKPSHDTNVEIREQASTTQETSSISERECAICLSTLHAPSPPDPVLLPTHSPSDSSPPTTTTPPEPILKLQICGHEFHSECLVSWFVLRKISCPICRALYISKEDMQAYEDEEAAVAAEQQGGGTNTTAGREGDGNRDREGVAVRVSNWRYFWAGEAVVARQGGRVGVVRREELERERNESRRLSWWRKLWSGRF